MKLSTLCIIYSIAMSLGNWFCMSRKGGTGGGGLVHPESENSMAMYWLAASKGPFLLFQVQWWPRKQSFCRASMQCSRTISFAQATYNKCLRTTDCSLVCSLEQESHTALFMLSIHNPDNGFMVLVSIFISNHNHFCVLCFRLAAAHATTALWRTEILNTVR